MANSTTAEALYPSMVRRAFEDRLVLRPTPPGDRDAAGNDRLHLETLTRNVDISGSQFEALTAALAAWALTPSELAEVVSRVSASKELSDQLHGRAAREEATDWHGVLAVAHAMDQLALLAIEIVRDALSALLDFEPLTEIHFRFSERAKVALAAGCEAMAKRGEFPLPPRGARRFVDLDAQPHGALHFVSASDGDSGHLYVMGIALSPEAQALKSMDVTYGLDGELIVPGQAVSPIPPFLAMSTRLFSASIPTSSNISEEVQSIPIRNFAHPTAIDDLEPRRGGKLKPPVHPETLDDAITDLRQQLARNRKARERRKPNVAEIPTGPEVDGVFDVTGLTQRQITHLMDDVLAEPELNANRASLALYLDVEPTSGDRVSAVCDVVDAAKHLGLRYVAVADDVEDSWLPNLLEYLDPYELNDVADYADEAGVVVLDGRPVDPVYTAATAAQRIQSVYTTLSVDILKMGMWLCLDALTARSVWQQILMNPHMPSQMLLMPIGIVEPWDAFVDNRRLEYTPRAILDPFEKIKFMIDEASQLKMPALLTDTRHKATWVLLGAKTPEDPPHVRERFVIDASTGDRLGRTHDSAIPLLSWDEFMQCERLAREAGILLGQAGSIEVDQVYRIISETTYDAAKDKRNPATAIWTAETERVLRTGSDDLGDLQSERSADVSPFLAVVNRAYESHAKLDGWLRFLADVGRGDNALRQDLENRRFQLNSLLIACLDAQKHEPSRYQERWDAFRSQYISYHVLIRDNFARVRSAVAEAWGTHD